MLQPTPLSRRGWAWTLANVITPDSEQTLTGLPAGATVSITVTARNDEGGESPPTAPVTAVVP